MSKKTFNPADWLVPTTAAENKPQQQTPETDICRYTDNDFETIVQRIERASTDIAPNYADWRDLGFAVTLLRPYTSICENFTQ